MPYLLILLLSTLWEGQVKGERPDSWSLIVEEKEKG
jgi:hypothetical protein